MGDIAVGVGTCEDPNMRNLPTSRPTRTSRWGRMLSGVLALAAAVALLTMPGTASAKGVTIKKATFAREVTSDFKAKGETTRFLKNETVFLLLRIKGRPKSGKVESTWQFRGEEIGKASVDLASVNKGVLFSFGEDTFVKFNFTPGPDGLPIGKTFAVGVTVNGESAGRYPFEVVPPKTAIPSRVNRTFLANAVDGPESKVFPAAGKVFLRFTADVGIDTWVEASWTVGSKVDPEGTRSLTIRENKKAADGNFSFLPAGGWPKGKNSVTLLMNDQQVGTYPFTVS